MGLCSSCGKSRDRFKDKGTKICGQIHSVVTPLHTSHEQSSSTYSSSTTIIHLNGHLPNNIKKEKLITSPAITATVMATSFPNMNITNPIKGLVSKRRNRYKQDGFNLDLTYITKNIIAMGYPASKIEGVYRNHIDDVVKLLDTKHKDHYFIYNLCSERCYDKSKFHNRVQIFPFDDHNPPKLELIQPFCRNVDEWLNKHKDNVAVVHCKAGKGRTGTMICCYLLHSSMFKTADEALNHYGKTRTQDRKGVTIPSQVRYVKYYEKILKNNLQYKPIGMNIKEIILKPAPNFPSGQNSVCFSISQHSMRNNEQPIQKCTKLYKSGIYDVKRNNNTTATNGVQQQQQENNNNFVINLDLCLVLTGDIKIEFYNKSLIGRKERQLQFWFNTYFINDEYENNFNNGFIEQNGSSANCCDKTYTITFKKHELDIINKKDKQNKIFSSDFQLTLLLQKITKNCDTKWDNWQIPNILENTPSESSEADSSDIDTNDEDEDDDVDGEEDVGWESGESTYL